MIRMNNGFFIFWHIWNEKCLVGVIRMCIFVKALLMNATNVLTIDHLKLGHAFPFDLSLQLLSLLAPPFDYQHLNIWGILDCCIKSTSFILRAIGNLRCLITTHLFPFIAFEHSFGVRGQTTWWKQWFRRN